MRTKIACAALVLVLAGLGATVASAQPDALAVQQAAIARLEALRAQYLRTLDAKPLRPALEAVDADLQQSTQVLRAAGDDGGLAAGLVKQGTVWQLLDQCTKAAGLYADAAAAAARAGRTRLATEAEAWSGKARCEFNQGHADQAAQDAERALAPARASDNHFALSRALGVLTDVHLQRKDAAAAEASSLLQLAAAAAASDKSTLYVAHLHRVQVRRLRLGECDHGGDVLPCLAALKADHADYVAARAVAVGLQSAANVGVMDSMLSTTALLIQLIEQRLR